MDYADIRGNALSVGDPVWMPYWRDRGFIEHPAVMRVAAFLPDRAGVVCAAGRRDPDAVAYIPARGETRATGTVLVECGSVCKVGGEGERPLWQEFPDVFRASDKVVLDVRKQLLGYLAYLSLERKRSIEECFDYRLRMLIERYSMTGRAPRVPEAATSGSMVTARFSLPADTAKRYLVTVPVEHLHAMVTAAILMTVSDDRGTMGG